MATRPGSGGASGNVAGRHATDAGKNPLRSLDFIGDCLSVTLAFFYPRWRDRRLGPVILAANVIDSLATRIGSNLPE
jgi:hypothetical protein